MCPQDFMRTTTTALIAIASLGQACGPKALNAGKGRGGADAATDAGGAVGSDGSAAGGAAAGGAITGDTSGSGGIDSLPGGKADADGTDGTAGSSVVGACTADTDCVAVLDYRVGFECWSPTAASIADVARDPCLVPWDPSNPRCPLVAPPGDCPSGPITVDHSCITFCRFAACTGGTCTLKSDSSTPSRCQMGAGAPPDCNILRATYLSALAATQTCDPARAPTSCFNAFYDSCGCPAAADLSSPRADALQCALDAVRQGGCGFGNCGIPCPSGNSTPACTPDAIGTSGTCTVY